MLIPQRLEPHVRPWRQAAGGSCGPPPSRAGPSALPIGVAVHRAPRSRPPQQAQWSPSLPLPISRLPGSDSQEAPPAHSRIGHTPLEPSRAPPLAQEDGTHGTHETDGTALARPPFLFPPPSGLFVGGGPRVPAAYAAGYVLPPLCGCEEDGGCRK